MHEKCLQYIFYFVSWFALWTIGSNWISFTGQESHYLIIWFFITIIVELILIFATIKKHFIVAIENRAILNFEHMNLRQLNLIHIGVVLFISYLITSINYKFHSIWIFFCGLCFLTFYMFFNYSYNKKLVLHQITDIKSVQDKLEFLITFLILAVLYYFGHQPDYDDANFINLGLGAFRSEFGVYVKDTMIGDGLTAIHLNIYKSQSYELLHGTLAELFSIESIFIAHIILPFIFLCIYTAVLYLVYRTILGNYLLIGVIFHLIFLIVSIDGFQSYGAHGIFRLFQGKIFFIQVLIPLLCYMGILHYKNPTFKSWLFLFCIQVSAVGMTVNAIYAAPLALGLILFPFFLSIFFVLIGIIHPTMIILSFLVAYFVNMDLFNLFFQRRGLFFTVGGILYHQFYYLYSSIAFIYCFIEKSTSKFQT